MSTEAQRKAILVAQATREIESGIKAQRLMDAAKQEWRKQNGQAPDMPDFKAVMDEKRTAYNLRRKKWAAGRRQPK